MNLKKLHNDIHEGALQLMAEHRVQLFARAKSICGNDIDADELVVRTIDQAIRRIDSYSGEGDILSWMMSILVNLHNNDHRKPVVRGTTAVEAEELERYAGADWSTDEQLLKNSDSEAIRAAIAGLDPKYNQVLMMRYYDEFSLKQIAAVLQLPLGTVSRRMQIAHRIISGKLAAEFSKVKPKLALLGAFLLAGSLFGAVTWGVVEAVSAVRSLGSEVALESEEPEAALESEGTLGSLESEGSLGAAADPVDPNPDPIVPKDSTETVPSPLSATGADTTAPATLSTTENTNTKEEETMNLKSITKSAAKLTVGAALTTGLAANAVGEVTWHYDDSTKTIASSDGLWELNVTRSGTNLTIGGYGCPKVPDADHRPAVLDLRTPITDDDGAEYVVTACASHAFDASDYQSAKDCWTDTLGELYLPGTMTSFGDYCVRNNSTLTKFVIEEPASMTSYPVMSGQPNLTTVLPLLPPNVTSITSGQFDGSKIVGDMVIGHPGATVTFNGTTLKNVKTLSSLEFNCDKVSFNSWCFEAFSTPTVWFHSAYPTSFGGKTFSGMTEKKCRFFIPKGDSTWDGRAVALADGDLTTYENIFGTDEPKPTGLITLGSSKKQFCVPYVDFVNTQSNALAICGDPEQITGVTPAYGFTRHVTETSVECSATGGTSSSGEIMACLGYTLETLGDDGEWANAEFHEETSFTLDLSDHVTRRLTWKYGVAGKSLTIHEPTIPFPTDPIGRVDLNPLPSVGETGYPAGTEVTLTAVPAPGCTFVRWHGDVPAGHEYDASFKVVMDQGFDITPEFHAPRWIYNSSTKKMTDGVWEVGATATGTNLALGSRATCSSIPTYPSYLDLGAPVTDASGETSYAIVSTAQNAFDGGDNYTAMQKVISSMRIPSTLTSIGAWSLRYLLTMTNLVFQMPCSLTSLPSGAFNGCTALRNVEPFLPDCITTVQGFGEVPVTNKLSIGRKGGTLTVTGNTTFKYIASPVIEINSKTVSYTGSWMFEGLAAKPCEIWYRCDYFENSQFSAVTADAIRIHVPASNPTWQAALANPAIVKPWDSSMKTAFEKYFPGQKHPKGRLIGTKPTNAWIDTFGSGIKLIFK